MKMRLLASALVSVLLALAVVALRAASYAVRAQSPAGDLLALINGARLNYGLYPFAVSVELAGAAQRHSDDMAATGNIDHTGSDGSSSTQRIMEAGYSVYEFGLVASENIYGGTGSAEIPFNAWMGQADARSNLLHDKYREIGIGVASDAQGRTLWTLDVGARPNVLPVFISNGASVVDTLTVTLRLVGENVVPEGRGTAMGQPVAYRASTSPQFPEADWAPWVELVEFRLDEIPGQQTVYVQLRDAAGRTAISQDSVEVTGLDVTVTPTTVTETVTPGTPAVVSPSPTAPGETATVSLTPSTTVQPSPTARPATETPSPSATATRSASATPTTSATSTPTPSATVPPPPSPTAPSTVTPLRPTATPAATTEITATPPPPTAQDVSATSLPPATSVAEPTRPPEPTPQPTPSGTAVHGAPQPGTLASRLLPWVLGLQVVAFMLGAYVALHRSEQGAPGGDQP